MPFSDIELEYLSSQRLGGSPPHSGRHPPGQPGRVPLQRPDRDIAGRGMAVSRKFRNVAENGQVAFVVDDFLSMQPWRPRCAEIRGKGKAITEPTESP